MKELEKRVEELEHALQDITSLLYKHVLEEGNAFGEVRVFIKETLPVELAVLEKNIIENIINQEQQTSRNSNP